MSMRRRILFLTAGLGCWGLSVVGACLAEAYDAGRRRVRAHETSRGFSPTPIVGGGALAEGPVVLEGRVAYATEANHAMFVEFIQEGAESESSGSWSYRWTERARRLTIAPFYLETAAGRVRVEPEPGHAQLADSLEGKILVPTEEEAKRFKPLNDGAPMRKRVATLVSGEHVWVVGRLTGGDDPEGERVANVASYRANAKAESLVLRGAPSLLVSSLSLESHFDERGHMHGRDRNVYGLFALVPLVVAGRFADRAFGVAVRGRIAQVTDLKDDDGDLTGHRLLVDTPLRRIETDVSVRVIAHPTDTIALRLGRMSENLGNEPAYTPGEGGVLLAAWFVVAVVATILRARGRVLPWYRSEKALLVDTGTGRLADSIQENRV